MYAVRLWSVRHAKGLNRLYHAFEWVIRRLHPLCARIGYDRLERPVAAVEKPIKEFLFDCRMCGQCVLSETGMSCPMNCPKALRNGPCGGVRADGGCEVEPEMRCVWVAAWEGAQRMGTEPTLALQAPVDHSLLGRSSWLRVVRALGQEAQPVADEGRKGATVPR
ncbi:MAG: methylenetetrahydrofolate reductase C-terminal domain-containing protein [Alphaproteobacteria bacterium]|nr:methylenetetrahydrofolate reductase C-terminal domain-containing protein [Alphaproteobacteria bacterium]